MHGIDGPLVDVDTMVPNLIVEGNVSNLQDTIENNITEVIVSHTDNEQNVVDKSFQCALIQKELASNPIIDMNWDQGVKSNSSLYIEPDTTINQLIVPSSAIIQYVTNNNLTDVDSMMIKNNCSYMVSNQSIIVAQDEGQGRMVERNVSKSKLIVEVSCSFEGDELQQEVWQEGVNDESKTLLNHPLIVMLLLIMRI
ncbi:hypothetical protein IEQ34_006655 [Dendrobium chrysotoxum]|uniref:Uncharacterized protein n=1 Tax=Dendrobium chrysotoxum TaxID=161865 RepID=A0AAV7H742_DENCH|nr:hypothetical protein IEQ34_006655 [Dendrobium chrysotoxum]